MIIEVTEDMFIQVFKTQRSDNFTKLGLIKLFSHFEDLEQDCDTNLKLDVIAICCDYVESTIEEALKEYSLETLEELQDITTVIEVSSNQIIYLRY